MSCKFVARASIHPTEVPIALDRIRCYNCFICVGVDISIYVFSTFLSRLGHYNCTVPTVSRGVCFVVNSVLVTWTLDFTMDSQEVFGDFGSKDSRLRCFVVKIIWPS